MKKNRIIFDAHQDIWMHEQDQEKEIIQTGFGEILKNSLKLVVASVFLDPSQTKGANKNQLAEMAESQIRSYLDFFENNAKWILIKERKDLTNLLESDMAGAIIHIEGMDFIQEDNISLIDRFYDLGLRSAGLVWGSDNAIGGYCGSDKGLTRFGKKVIKNLNQRNILIDLAHANEKTFYGTLDFSEKPVMVSHGNCFDICPDPRNFKEDQLKALAENGGVQGIFFSKKYVSHKEGVSVEDVLEHFRMSYQISSELTILGSDFGGISSGFVKKLDNIGQLSGLLDQIETGFGKKAAERISYKNFLKFLEKNYEKQG